MYFKYFITCFTFFFTISVGAVENQDSEKVKLAIDYLKTACASGEEVGFNIDGKGGLSLLKLNKGLEASISFTKEDARGVAKGLSNDLQSKNLDSVRECMRPYINKILEYILGQDHLISYKSNKDKGDGFVKEQFRKLLLQLNSDAFKDPLPNERSLLEFKIRISKVREGFENILSDVDADLNPVTVHLLTTIKAIETEAENIETPEAYAHFLASDYRAIAIDSLRYSAVFQANDILRFIGKNSDIINNDRIINESDLVVNKYIKLNNEQVSKAKEEIIKKHLDSNIVDEYIHAVELAKKRISSQKK